MKLIPIIRKINGIEREISENQTVISTILPLFQYLGWDIFDENSVIFEDTTATKKRVDITFIDGETTFFIEAKRLTHKLSMKDFEQLTLYINSDETINFGILTNGVDYWVADNRKEGLEGKKIFEFNIFDLTDCDLTVLRKFFSFSAPFNISDIDSYIHYIQTGISFGDKECRKILEISNFENDKVEDEDGEFQYKSSEALQEEKNSTKPQFEEKEEESDNQSEEEELESETPEDEKKDGKKETVESEENQKIDVLKEERDGEVKEFFEFLDKSQAKIYLNGEYHIIGEKDFPALAVKILRYIFQQIKPFPSLYQKTVENFDFIVPGGERGQQSAKYEQIADSIYFNSNINNVTKLKNIESLLKFIFTNFE
jgi:hypothetical protein